MATERFFQARGGLLLISAETSGGGANTRVTDVTVKNDLTSGEVIRVRVYLADGSQLEIQAPTNTALGNPAGTVVAYPLTPAPLFSDITGHGIGGY